jgi:MFS family permease
MFSALRYRNFRLFWLGQLVSVSGSFMQSTAQQWLVLTLSPHNPMPLGIVGALQFGPLLVPFGGAIADRFPRRYVLMLTQAAAALLALALWLLTAAGVVQLWHVYVLAFLLGLVNAVDMPTRQAFVGEMVPAEGLLNAVSLNSAQFNASRIVGPGLAGALIAIFGVPPMFLFNAISFLAVIVGLWYMRPQELMPVPRRPAEHGLARLRALGDGARFVLASPSVRVTFLMIAVIGTMGFNFNVLLPLEATGILRSGPAVFGLLTSALGVGALVGALLLARRQGAPTNRLLVGSAAAFGLLEAALALTRSIPLTLALMAVIGFMMSSFGASANTRVQLATPIEMRGRVMALYTMLFVGTTPIGNLLTSGVASAGGVPLAFVVSGLPSFLVALAAAALWRRVPPADVDDGDESADGAPSRPELSRPAPQLAQSPEAPLAGTAQR